MLIKFCLACLLNINFALLRGARNAIAVADLAGSATLIPLYELFGVLPVTILLSWIMTSLLNRYTLTQVFTAMMGLFVSFFLLFAFVIHPLVSNQCQTAQLLASCTFYVMAELWKVVLITVLFWTLLNSSTSLEKAKQIYSPLMLAASIGTFLAGPLSVFCTSVDIWQAMPLSSSRWGHSLRMITTVVTLLGILAALLYYRLSNRRQTSTSTNEQSPSYSIVKAIKTSYNTPAMRMLSWIVIADYLAYSLAEVIFLHVLKQHSPDPADYCRYMGTLSTISGILTAISALWIAPYLLQRYPWVVSASITPLLVIVCEVLFFSVYCFKTPCIQLLDWSNGTWITVCVILGSIQYTLCRAAKYTLLDTTKELVFISMPTVIAIEGKIAIDGIGSRAGRGLSSGFTLILTMFIGGIAQSAPAASLVAIVFSASWLWCTVQLGKLLEASPQERNI